MHEMYRSWGRALAVLALCMAFGAVSAQAQDAGSRWKLQKGLSWSDVTVKTGGDDTEPPPAPPPPDAGYESTGGDGTEPPPAPPPPDAGYESTGGDDTEPPPAPPPVLPGYERVNGAGETAAAFGADARQVSAPASFSGNYPNPFNPETTIGFEVRQAQTVRLTVYNMLGQAVAFLVDGEMEAGRHDVRFSADRLPSGIYLARLQTQAGVATLRMVLAK